MITEYDEEWNCYKINIKLKFGERKHDLDAVIDTGASYTTIGLYALLDGDIDMVLKISAKLADYAQRIGIKCAAVRGATEEPDATKACTYDACFDNVNVGGFQVRKFHVKILINGAKNICVIGNDFLNMCDYQHKAKKRQLIIENFDGSEYYKSFGMESVLSSEQLNMLLADTKERITESDQLIK